MGKSTISMAIFHCYVSSPEGKLHKPMDSAVPVPCWAGRSLAFRRHGVDVRSFLLTLESIEV